MVVTADAASAVEKYFYFTTVVVPAHVVECFCSDPGWSPLASATVTAAAVAAALDTARTSACATSAPTAIATIASLIVTTVAIVLVITVTSH